MIPSTPLPWTDETFPGFLLSKLRIPGYRKEVKQDDAYKLHACNAYPLLVEFVRSRKGRTDADTLLRQLGEVE